MAVMNPYLQADAFYASPCVRWKKPVGKSLEWFLIGRGRKKWATAEEAAAINGISRSTLSRDDRRFGCPYSVCIGGRVFYRRECLGHLSPCWDLAEFAAAEAQAREQRAATRQERKATMERRQLELTVRRAARDRHRIRVNQRHEILMACKEKWKRSGRPWLEWVRFKKELKEEWKRDEALELGRDELRLAGKPLDAPGADDEAYRLGIGILVDRMGKRLIMRGG